MISVHGARNIPYPPPNGNFAERFEIQVPEDFITRDIVFNEENKNCDSEILHQLKLYIIRNNLLDKVVTNSDNIEFIVSPLNFMIDYIMKV